MPTFPKSVSKTGYSLPGVRRLQSPQAEDIPCGTCPQYSLPGKLVWKRDLSEEFGATTRQFGYSSHPLLYRDRLIVVSGGKGKAVAALEQRSGRVLWADHTFRNAFSSPFS
ncbi:MAG: PQQ-binding-like beta-propeller repeat protein [Bryobacteraceae bacterium]